jgi:hypothetical protein
VVSLKFLLVIKQFVSQIVRGALRRQVNNNDSEQFLAGWLESFHVSVVEKALGLNIQIY